jgi:hypothetical protein
MKKYLILAGLVWWFPLLAASNAYACSCVKPEVPQAFREARAVFFGEVLEIIQPQADSPTAPLADRLFRIRFKVERSWKGAATQEIIISSDQGRAGCFSWGPFEKGRKYLVYAERRTPSGAPTKYLAVLFKCNRTDLLANATADLKILDAMRGASDQKRVGAASRRKLIDSAEVITSRTKHSAIASTSCEHTARLVTWPPQ